MTYLCELAKKWGTDKGPDDGHKYTPVYAGLIKDTNSVRKVLEIGVGRPEAPSLRMWEEFFPQAQIYSADSNRAYFATSGGRVLPTIYCDQSNSASLARLAQAVGDSFDLVVDDGSHASEDQLLTIKTLLPIIRIGGFYVIEDIWEDNPFGGGSVKDLIIKIKPYLADKFSLDYTRTGDRDSSLIIVERKA